MRVELFRRVFDWCERVILERDEENSYLILEEGDEDLMRQVLVCSVSYRITIGPQKGNGVFTLQTIPSREEDDRFAQVVKVAGFSLQAGIAAHACERKKLERLA